MKYTLPNAVVNQSVPRSPLSADTKNNRYHSRLASLVSSTYLKTKGAKITSPIKCSKKIIVIGGNVYKYCRISPSRAQSNAAMIINIGPLYFRKFFNTALCLLLFELLILLRYQTFYILVETSLALERLLCHISHHYILSNALLFYY